MFMLLKKSIANFFTILNLVLGFFAIILIALSFNNNVNYISTACILIYFATMIDVFDGKIARKLGTSGDFGKQIDSLADLVSFCLVPSFLIFSYYYDPLNSENMNLRFGCLVVLCSFPLVCGAIRLAKFNAYEEQSEKKYYLGLPTPGNALFICSMILFMEQKFLSIANDVIFSNILVIQFFILPLEKVLFTNYFSLLLICNLSSLLLISKIHYSKFPVFKINLDKNNLYNLLGVFIFFIFFVFGLINKQHNIVILLFITYYIVFGFIVWFIRLFKKKGA